MMSLGHFFNKTLSTIAAPFSLSPRGEIVPQKKIPYHGPFIFATNNNNNNNNNNTFVL